MAGWLPSFQLLLRKNNHRPIVFRMRKCRRRLNPYRCRRKPRHTRGHRERHQVLGRTLRAISPFAKDKLRIVRQSKLDNLDHFGHRILFTQGLSRHARGSNQQSGSQYTCALCPRHVTTPHMHTPWAMTRPETSKTSTLVLWVPPSMPIRSRSSPVIAPGIRRRPPATARSRSSRHRCTGTPPAPSGRLARPNGRPEYGLVRAGRPLGRLWSVR